ncbi:MAG: type II toxin-antitoxin system HicA family toxin [Candidatus Omnitrophica bacterium]|nr:type II toxin-antitoxin system HicA family toxin [Candidatus Omnitrophota bacterium]
MTLSSKDIKRILERHGFLLSRQRGSHQQFVNEAMILRSGANVNHLAKLIPSFNHKARRSEGWFNDDACPSAQKLSDRASGLGLNLSK